MARVVNHPDVSRRPSCSGPVGRLQTDRSAQAGRSARGRASGHATPFEVVRSALADASRTRTLTSQTYRDVERWPAVATEVSRTPRSVASPTLRPEARIAIDAALGAAGAAVGAALVLARAGSRVGW